jgi:predicted small secreted protein
MRHIVILSGLLTLIALSACNTVKGMGKDISQAGDAVGDAFR